MKPETKPNIFKQLLERKAAGQQGRGTAGIIGDNDLARKFSAGEKARPIIRRGGRNGSGKP